MTATSTPADRRETLIHARAEALFASDLEPSTPLDRDVVAAAVQRTVRRHGVRGCAALVAFEYGEHPATAVPRMEWATAAVAELYPPRVRRDYIWARAAL
jgi:hypothetical protein